MDDKIDYNTIMDIKVADERILLHTDQISAEEARDIAWKNKTKAFDTFSQVTSFLSRPKDDDFTLMYEEHRYQPFWQVAATAHYVYDRSAKYQVPVTGSEVQSITLLKTDFETMNGHIHIDVLEHCRQDETDEVFIDGVNSKNEPKLSRYITFTTKDVTKTLAKDLPKEAIVVPPNARVSAIMRDTLAKMIKGIQADTILEEKVEVTAMDLHYQPIYAFQYRWQSKNKEAIVEVDGLTGEVTTGNRTFKEYLGKALDQNFLFDLGADAAGMFVPGGSIAVKVAKKYIDSKRAKK